MPLLPLALSVRASSWRLCTCDHGGELGASLASRRDAACRFCGASTGPWAEPFHLDDDHANDAPENVVAACPLCHACQHLGRDSINQEFALVWLPEVPQAALNLLVRATHLVFHAHGESAHMTEPPSRDTPHLRSAYLAYRALAERSAPLRERLGTGSPRVLGEALLGLAAGPMPTRAPGLVDGVRLLSRGRLFRDGVDVYPRCLDAWSRPSLL